MIRRRGGALLGGGRGERGGALDQDGIASRWESRRWRSEREASRWTRLQPDPSEHRIGAGFGVSTATAWRYVEETVTLLSARSPKLGQALRKAKQDGLHYLVLDGTLIRTDGIKADRPYFSGKHRVHGMNVQVIATPDGMILWTSGALPGKTHDLSAARIWAVLRALEQAGIITLADKAYQGAEGLVLTPYKGKDKPESQKQANRAHAKLRGPGERANAQMKSWRILRKLRCSPSKAGHLCKAIAVLQNHRAAQAA
ncbi:DDE superfamily endonuclease [Nonomuraea polychroma]|uniref:DDE superfamily endonuclease n=1 Tax=Nonomuraea polychroma TaxID=46176 RepID=A0A438M850_9ACTN|nr:DDE superfamily endonuclease [Nonomuraea polychroma]